jgi:hypothetical protein
MGLVATEYFAMIISGSKTICFHSTFPFPCRPFSLPLNKNSHRSSMYEDNTVNSKTSGFTTEISSASFRQQNYYGPSLTQNDHPRRFRQWHQHQTRRWTFLPRPQYLQHLLLVPLKLTPILHPYILHLQAFQQEHQPSIEPPTHVIDVVYCVQNVRGMILVTNAERMKRSAFLAIGRGKETRSLTQYPRE